MKMYSKIKNTLDEGGLPLLFKKTWRKFRISYLDYLAPAHQMPRGLPPVRVEMQRMMPTEKDILIAKRILASFHKASREEKKYAKPDISVDDMDTWDNIKKVHHADFYRIVSSDDPRQVADHLCNMHSSGLTNGISGSLTEYNHMVSSTRLRNEKGAAVKDILVSFAEALGVLRYEASVQYVAKKNIYIDSDALVDEIEKSIGIPITPPEIDGGLFKLKLKKGSFDIRDLWSLYTAWRMSNVLNKNAPICEIGAGIGKVALWANRFHFFDYTIFDLPMINVIQAWYLIKSLPEKKIMLYGEKDDAKDAIKIMPYWKFTEGTGHYELVLNEDSFPEINSVIVDRYLQKIKECAKYFLSINQEFGAPSFPGASQTHLIVPDRVKASGGFRRIYRFPFWLRNGYVEELYEIKPHPKL